MLQKFSPTNTPDTILNRIQDQIQKILRPVLDNQVLDGVLLQEVDLASGLNVIEHKLGRKLVGWFIVRLRANENIWDTQDSNQLPAKTLYLNATGAVTVDVYVF